ncbi:hypothetical protein A3D85_01800 [Candidatus Amesbacteria bacterium RIFCSPHIGHO2_02_FULL_47_9]|nr:MAG: hypothetical protein A3D85_01800 [Candidatus Amesbacteria bacterium RIFCSPHIGHO2_02_FULL_47_9]
MSKVLQFPKGFLWGAATAAHQIEGNNTNSDWWEWEQKGGGVEPSGIACDSYNRYEEDFTLAKNLGHNAHRLSIEWARIEPLEREFSKQETDHYRKVLESLKDKNIKSFVTLHHFTNPLWFAKKGGWEDSNAPEVFSKYVKYCVENFSDLIDFWVTINEPNVYAFCAYSIGKFPPQRKNLVRTANVYLNLCKAHKLGFAVIKTHQPQAHVGFTLNLTVSLPETENFWDKIVSGIFNWFNCSLLIYLLKDFDYLGINYYLTFKVKSLKFYRDYSEGVSEAYNIPVVPRSLYYLLKNLKVYNKPVYITENGIADSRDKLRKDYIREHLLSVNKAISEGIDVRGYLHWSLIDNFEWHKGFGPKFGLVEISRENNLKRIPRKSALFYAKVCKSNKIHVRS